VIVHERLAPPWQILQPIQAVVLEAPAPLLGRVRRTADPVADLDRRAALTGLKHDP